MTPEAFISTDDLIGDNLTDDSVEVKMKEVSAVCLNKICFFTCIMILYD